MSAKLNCILSDDEKEELKELFADFQKKESGNKKDLLDDAEKCIKAFSGYVCRKDSLNLDDYTNTKQNQENKYDLSLDDYMDLEQNQKKIYLCDFLERRTDAFGSSRPGSSDQFMVKKNDDEAIDKKTGKSKFEENTYTVIKIEKKKKSTKKANAQKSEAESEYNEKIKPLLKAIFDAKGKDEIKKIEGNELYQQYQAKQILRKMIVLNNPYDQDFPLGFFYQDDAVNCLMEKFYGKTTNKFSFFEKSNLVMSAAIEILGLTDEINVNENEIKEDERKERKWLRHIVSGFLWRLAKTTASIVSEKFPNVILYGAPGTGKTYKVKNMIDFVCQSETNSHYEWVQFHPSFSYEDFIEGIKPTGINNENGSVKLELVNGVFKNFCIKAKNALENFLNDEKAKEEPIYYFIVDEINRANLSAVFGETLSLLESSYRDYKKDETDKDKYSSNVMNLQYTSIEQEEIKKNGYDKDKHYNEKGQFGIPRNVRFIGMMNDVDKSIDAFDLALRRRFKWIRESCDYEVVEAEIKKKDIKDKDAEEYKKSCIALNNYITDEIGLGKSYEFGHSFFMKITDYVSKVGKNANKITDDNKKKLFEELLSPTLKEYLRSSVDEKDIEDRLKNASNKFIGGK